MRKGYDRTTAVDVARLAGVSRKTLYQHFGGKEPLFLATHELVVEWISSRVSTAYSKSRREGVDPVRALRGATEVYLAALRDRPAQARLALGEVLALGVDAGEALEQSKRAWIAILDRGLGDAAGVERMPAPILGGALGGAWFVSRTRIVGAARKQAARNGRELTEWLLSLCGSQALDLPAIVPEVEPRGRRAPRACDDERGRMLDAALALAAGAGHEEVSNGAITAHSRIARNAFSRQFESPVECLLEAVELRFSEALDEAVGAAGAASGWERGVCRALATMLARVARDRDLAVAAFWELHTLGAPGANCRVGLIRCLASALGQCISERDAPSPVFADAIAASIWALCFELVAAGRPERLPEMSASAAYLALAPIVGAAAARTAIEAENRAGSTNHR
ncbi:MAG: TetR/AcrR family transcriptional regulator [Actinobacteria bacterium]|nr:TetR/AcrR family transcriptional regulator [Actinomycetota bacterium]